MKIRGRTLSSKPTYAAISDEFLTPMGLFTHRSNFVGISRWGSTNLMIGTLACARQIVWASVYLLELSKVLTYSIVSLYMCLIEKVVGHLSSWNLES